MRTRFVLVLACLALAVATLPVGGCGDNDNSSPCCPVCADGVCGGDENSCNCLQDCPNREVNPTSCVAALPECGNGVCETSSNPGESHERCAADCPLDCHVCEGKLRVFANGTVTRGAACPPGTIVAYRDGDNLVCHSCTTAADCPKGQSCHTQRGPGCEDDTGGCCPMRVCSSF